MENVGGGAGNEGSKRDRKQMVQMGLRCLMNSRSKEKPRTGLLEKSLRLLIKHCLDLLGFNIRWQTVRFIKENQQSVPVTGMN